MIFPEGCRTSVESALCKARSGLNVGPTLGESLPEPCFTLYKMQIMSYFPGRLWSAYVAPSTLDLMLAAASLQGRNECQIPKANRVFKVMWSAQVNWKVAEITVLPRITL